jgi:hypothetical protein
MQEIQIPDYARPLLEAPAAPGSRYDHRIYAGCSAPLD